MNSFEPKTYSAVHILFSYIIPCHENIPTMLQRLGRGVNTLLQSTCDVLVTGMMLPVQLFFSWWQKSGSQRTHLKNTEADDGITCLSALTWHVNIVLIISLLTVCPFGWKQKAEERLLNPKRYEQYPCQLTKQSFYQMVVYIFHAQLSGQDITSPFL